METRISPVDSLERLIEDGAFKSQLQDYLDRTFRYNQDSWFAKAIREEGSRVAQARLERWVAAQHRDEFATSLEQIARGMVSLGRANNGLLDISDIEPKRFSMIESRYGPLKRYLLLNASAPGCGCMQPEGSSVWGPYSMLGLRALIIEHGFDYKGPATKVTLVLPFWQKSGFNLELPSSAVVFASFDSTGYSTGDRYSLYQDTEVGDEMASWEELLRYLLGLDPSPVAGRTQQISTSMEGTLGFPGAEAYIASELIGLRDYLEALAEKLTAPHAH